MAARRKVERRQNRIQRVSMARLSAEEADAARSWWADEERRQKITRNVLVLAGAAASSVLGLPLLGVPLSAAVLSVASVVSSVAATAALLSDGQRVGLSAGTSGTLGQPLGAHPHEQAAAPKTP